MILAPVKISLRELADQASRAAAEHPVMRDRQRMSIELRPDVHKEAYDRDSEARMVFARSVLKAAGVTLESDKQRVLFVQHIWQTIYPESDFELWLAGWKAAASTRDRPEEGLMGATVWSLEVPENDAVMAEYLRLQEQEQLMASCAAAVGRLIAATSLARKEEPNVAHLHVELCAIRDVLEDRI